MSYLDIAGTAFYALSYCIITSKPLFKKGHFVNEVYFEHRTSLS
jgi:hypothetical protein